MDEDITFGQWLRRRRRALDLTQSDLARLAGYSVSAIRKVENDERKPSREMAERLAEKLRVSPAEQSHLMQLARGTLGTGARMPLDDEDDGQRSPIEPAVPPTPEPRRSSSPRGTNLPLALTSFIGREAEKREIKSLLRTKRVVTLTGAGGCGKTRLAVQVASEIHADYPDGVWFVELAPLDDPARVPPAVALALGLPEKSDEAILTTLLRHLEERRTLLLVDNCEHLLDASASLIEALLRRCPQLTILATTREPLRLEGEKILRVPSLDVPARDSLFSPAALLRFDATRLFVDRAEAQAGFSPNAANAPAIVEICRRLDGIPLAIELAAARTSGLTVEQVARRLDRQFELLTSGSRTALPRQQTLRATLDWSFALLTGAERILLRRLAVFVGGFSLEAAEEIGSGNGLDKPDVLTCLLALVDKSLVVAREQGYEARYHLLEPIRQYTWELLASSGEADAMSERHRNWYVALVGSVGNGLWSVHQATWRERLEREHGNLRVVLAWCKEHDAATGLRIATTLSRFWMDRGYLSEGRDWLEAMLERAPERTITRARALQALGYRHSFLSSVSTARAVLVESLGICEELGDNAGLGVALGNLGWSAGWEGDYRQARDLYERALLLLREAGDLHEAGDQSHLGIISGGLGELADWEGHHEEARRLYEDAVAAFRQVAGDGRGVGYTHSLLGDLQRRFGDRERARESLELSLKLAREIGHATNTGMALIRLARLARDEGDLAQARAALVECLAFLREKKRERESRLVLLELGKLALVEGNDAQAKSQVVEALSLLRAYGSRLETASAIASLGGLAIKTGEGDRGARLIAAARALDAVFWTSLESEERSYYEERIAEAKRALGDAVFAQFWAEGQAMTLEKAVAYALGGL